MKKFLSIILATVMLLSIIPVAFASDTTAKSYIETYDFAATENIPLALTHRGENADYVDYIIGDVTYSLLKAYHTDYTAQNWKWIATNNETIMKASKASQTFRMVSNSYLQLSLSATASGYTGTDPTLALALAFKAPTAKAAFYCPTIYIRSGGYTGSNYTLYLRKLNADWSGVDSIGYYTDSKHSTSITKNGYAYNANKAIYTRSGDEFVLGITAQTSDHRFDYVTLTEILNPTIAINEASYSLVVGENDTASISTTVTGKTVIDSVETNVSLDVAKEFLTYQTGDASVATVSADGTVTAKGAGKTTVWAESTDGIYASAPVAVTVTDPTKPTIKYDILSRGTPAGVELSTFTDYSQTDGFWKYYGKGNGGQEKYMKIYLDGGSNGWNDRLELIGCGGNTEGNYIALKINVPEKGKYTVTQYYGAGSNGTENAVMHILPGNTEKSDVIAASNDSNKVLTLNCYATSSQAAASSSRTVSGTYEFEAGEYLLVYRNLGTVADSNIFIGNIILTAGSGDALIPSFSGNTTLEVGDTATLKGFLSSTATAATVTYNSSNDCVTVSNDGTITAVKPGKAMVTMMASDSTVVAANPYTVEITVLSAEDEELSGSFDDAVVGSVPSDYIAPTVTTIEAEGIVGTPVPVSGGAYKITAAETSESKGNFLYWKKAMTVNEKIVSFGREFNYVPEGNERNILVAVYEGDVSLISPKCYNANGQYLPGTTPVEADLPSMAGYGKACAWAEYRDTNVYVAQYEAENPIADIDVTVNGENTSGGGTNLAYGAEVTCTATGENFKCWKKTYGDGTAKIVSTEAVYKFNAWEDCMVEAIYEENVHYTGPKMKIIIDNFVAGDETGVMAEFLGFDNNVVEKGIMFNDNRIAMTTVGNQFSVIADEEGTYKGYAIVGNATDGYTLITDGEYIK